MERQVKGIEPENALSVYMNTLGAHKCIDVEKVWLLLLN